MDLFFEAWPVAAQFGFLGLLAFIGALLFYLLGIRIISVFGGVLNTTVVAIPQSIDRQSEMLAKLEGSIHHGHEREAERVKYTTTLQSGQALLAERLAQLTQLGEAHSRSLDKLTTQSGTIMAASDETLKNMRGLDDHIEDMTAKLTETRKAAQAAQANTSGLRENVEAVVSHIENIKTALHATQIALTEQMDDSFRQQERLVVRMFHGVEKPLQNILAHCSQSRALIPEAGEGAQPAPENKIEESQTGE